MQPFERLRYIARRHGDDRALVTDAAECLAAFGHDAPGLVVACRRLVDHHLTSAPLWWLCTRVLAALDPADAAWEAEELVRDDRTSARLAELLPFPHAQPIAVLGWPELAGEALRSRPDLDVLMVRGPGDDRSRTRLAGSAATARPVDVIEATVFAPSHVLVEPTGASPTHALVTVGTTQVLDELVRPATLVWLVAGVGRVLPARLFEALLSRLGTPGRHGLEVIEVQVADRIAGPAGLERPEWLGRRVDAPIAPELLRPA